MERQAKSEGEGVQGRGWYHMVMRVGVVWVTCS